jgi:putative ubiquitin-RnfH superfamily antitoxin RatB of RatAB toxin-antitoxin module
MADTLRVCVVYAEPARQIVRELEVVSGATVADAIRLSAIATAAGLTDADLARTGIFGRIVGHSTVLRDGDRVEILRRLKVDPKEARRRRAAKKADTAAGRR